MEKQKCVIFTKFAANAENSIFLYSAQWCVCKHMYVANIVKDGLQ